MDPRAILADPDFRAASPEAQRATLSKHDPDFAAASGEVQDRILMSAPREAPTGAPKPGVGEVLWQNLKATPGRMASDAMGAGRMVLNEILNPKMSTVLPLALPGAGSVLTRIAAAGAGHMLDNPSQNPVENLTTFGKGAALPAALEAAVPMLGKLARSTGWGRSEINRADAARFGEAAGEAAPTLYPGRDVATMQRVAEGQGLERIGGAKEQAVQDIERALGGRPLNVPSAASASTVPGHTAQLPTPRRLTPDEIAEGVPLPTTGSTATAIPGHTYELPMGLRDANAELSRIGDMMRGIRPLDPRYKDADLKDLYGKIAQEIRGGILQEGGPQAAAQWDATQSAYRAGRGVLGLMERPGLFRQGQFNASDLQRYLKDPDNRAALARRLGGNLATGENLDAYNSVVNSITRGAPAGMVDELAGKAPGLLSGRGSYGAWRLPIEIVRTIFPNASSKYVGRVPLTAPPQLQSILDAAAGRVLPQAAQETR